MTNAHEPPEQEKPYQLVPFAAANANRAAPAGHAQLGGRDEQSGEELLFGRFDLRLTALAPIQVGSGHRDILQTADGNQITSLTVTVRRYVGREAQEDEYVVPGSSFKGVLRSVVEAMSPSCVRVVAWRTQKVLPPDLEGCRRRNALCPACRLFGMSGRGDDNYQGQVSVEDVRLLRGRSGHIGTPVSWQPARGGNPIPERYLEGEAGSAKRARGRKLYYHSGTATGEEYRQVIAAQSEWQGWLHVENVTAAELGLLAASLGLHPAHPFPLKVGGGKHLGLGSMRVALAGVQIGRSSASFGRQGRAMSALPDADVPVRIAEWASRAEETGLLIGRALEEVAQVLDERGLQSRAAPEGMY